MQILKEKTFPNGATFKLIKLGNHNFLITHNTHLNDEGNYSSINKASSVINNLINTYNKLV